MCFSCIALSLVCVFADTNTAKVMWVMRGMWGIRVMWVIRHMRVTWIVYRGYSSTPRVSPHPVKEVVPDGGSVVHESLTVFAVFRSCGVCSPSGNTSSSSPCTFRAS